MNWGIFVGLGFIGNVLLFIVGLIVFFALLYIVLATPVGLFLLIGLIIYGLYRLFR